MTYQERKTLIDIISSVLIFGIYGFIVYQRYLNGAVDTTDVFVFWSRFILILIPITIVAKIITVIIFTIMNSIVTEVTGGEEDDVNLVDERDKLIDLKTVRNSMVFFSLGFVLALASQLVGFSNHAFFIIIVVFGLMGDLFGGASKIWYYRRGV